MQFPKKNKYFVFDIETTSLKRTSEILQIACVSLNDISKGYNVYSTSEGQISPSASKVNNLTTAFQAGKKVLLKINQLVAAIVHLARNLCHHSFIF